MRLMLDKVVVANDAVRISGPKPPWRPKSPPTIRCPRPSYPLPYKSGAPDRIRTCDLCLRSRPGHFSGYYI